MLHKKCIYIYKYRCTNIYIYIYKYIIYIHLHKYKCQIKFRNKSWYEHPRSKDCGVGHRSVGQIGGWKRGALSLPFQHLEIHLVADFSWEFHQRYSSRSILSCLKVMTELDILGSSYYWTSTGVSDPYFVIQGTVSSSDICSLILAISVLRLKKSVSIAPKAPRPWPSYPSWLPSVGSPWWVAVNTSVLPCDGEDLLTVSSAMATLENARVV